MKLAMIGVLCLAMAGCSQTTEGSGSSASASPKSAAPRAGAKKASSQKTRDACDEAVKAHTNAAMLGGALGMVGSFGGYGGRGGMVASHVASTAGNMVATSQSAKAQAGVERECL